LILAISNFLLCLLSASSVHEAIQLAISPGAYAHAGASTRILTSREPSLLDELAGDIRTVNPSIRVEIVECDTTSSASVEARSYD
jgi:hypothetical protein